MDAKSAMPYLREQVDLQTYNSFGIKAFAKYWFEVSHEVQAREFLMDNGLKPDDIFILGGGSNILLTGDVEKVVLKNNILEKTVVEENDDYVLLKLGAGENWHEAVLYCVEKNWGGIENLSLIPGTVGAAPIQNIGAYGVELKDVFVSLEAMDLRTGIVHSFTREDCAFGYRDSLFKRAAKGKYLITHIVLKLSKHPVINSSYGALEAELVPKDGKIGIREVSEAVIRIRQRKLPDPKIIGNAGSFFKNPVIKTAHFELLQEKHPHIPHYPQQEGVKIPAAWLIQSCGWKGKRWGDYGVHENQALVLVNYGNASGQDIYELSEKIKESVQGTFGIALNQEVNIL